MWWPQGLLTGRRACSHSQALVASCLPANMCWLHTYSGRHPGYGSICACARRDSDSEISRFWYWNFIAITLKTILSLSTSMHTSASKSYAISKYFTTNSLHMHGLFNNATCIHKYVSIPRSPKASHLPIIIRTYLDLYKPYSVHMSPENTHKLMDFIWRF